MRFLDQGYEIEYIFLRSLEYLIKRQLTVARLKIQEKQTLWTNKKKKKQTNENCLMHQGLDAEYRANK